MKNPWLGLWLSSANRSAGMARGAWAAELQRQQNALFRSALGAKRGTTGAKSAASRTRKKGKG